MSRTPFVNRCAVAAVLLAATAFGPPVNAATLVAKGRARAFLIPPERAAPRVEGARRGLRDHMRQMSGADLPIRRENQITGSPTADRAWVLVGEGKLANRQGLSSKGLGAGGISL